VNPTAPPASPEAHTAGAETSVWTASLVVIRSGMAAFIATALAGQVISLVIEVFGGGLARSTELTLGWFYALAFHRVAMEVTASGGATGRLSIALMSGTAFAVWILFRAGRAAARQAGRSLPVRVISGAMVGPVYALPIAVVTSLVRLQLRTGGGLLPETVRLHGVVWQAFVFPAVLGIAAGGAGGAIGSLARGSRARGWLVGGWLGLLWALGLAAVGLLILAAVRPQGTASYARVVSSNGPRVALLILGHQSLLLPNQSFLVLAPSMGGCTQLAGSDATISLVCPGRLPVLESPALLEDVARVGGAAPATATATDRPMPGGYWAFLLVPALAALAAGRTAGRCAGTSATGPARLRRAAVRGAGAGTVFALLVGAGTWMAGAAVSVGAADGSGTTSLTLGPPPLATALLALAWGVAGGTLGAWIRGQDVGTPVAGGSDEPVPPSPTSV
jgi:hypothetical protein